MSETDQTPEERTDLDAGLRTLGLNVRVYTFGAVELALRAIEAGQTARDELNALLLETGRITPPPPPAPPPTPDDGLRAAAFIDAVLDTHVPDGVFPMVVQVRDVLAVAQWLAPVHAALCAAHPATTPTAGEGDGLAEVIAAHADCTLNDGLMNLGSVVTGRDVWSCGITVPFEERLEDAEHAHVADAIRAAGWSNIREQNLAAFKAEAERVSEIVRGGSREATP